MSSVVPRSPAGEVPSNRAPSGVPVELLRKYDRPGPRYTSYPTAVEFHEGFDASSYCDRLAHASARADAPLSLYVHLPFCKERCTFCGCMVVITQKPEVSLRYLEYLHREIAMLAAALGNRTQILQYHWGGGTPTYLSVAQMAALHDTITRFFAIRPGAEAAIEVDPRVTSFEQLALLRQMGFNRLSLGVQDFTPEVQAAVNRVQPESQTRAVFDEARRLGFGSINIDLIYGLPLQTRESFGRAIDTVISIRPDRVAVYSYAHVPWIRAHQKRLELAELPTGDRKLELFSTAMDRFLAAGYAQIGMDHFALPDDELARAADRRELHRNFMGYTTRPATDLVGLGVSAIGDLAGAFAQNTKKLSSYYTALDSGRFPTERGYVLDPDDHLRRYVIAQLMCTFEVDYARVEARSGVCFTEYFARELEELAAGPCADGLISLEPGRLALSDVGRLLVRNVAMTFDRHLRTRMAGAPVPIFSRTV
jgi:oxygen-independent coproporphyrinogen III oxidase